MGNKEGGLLRQKIQAILEGLPLNYEARYLEITKISHMFHEELARSLEPSISQFAISQTSDNLESRRHLATTINENLRNIHLAIRCPKTNRPGILVADSKDAEQKILRYRIQVHDDKGGSIKTWTSHSLPPIDLMESQHRVENLSRVFRESQKKGPAR